MKYLARVFVATGVTICCLGTAQAQAPAAITGVKAQAVSDVNAGIEGEERTRHTREGFVCHFSTKPGEFIPHDLPGFPSDEEIALAFVDDQRVALGVRSPHATFEVDRVHVNGRVATVNLKQSYRGIPVIGSGVVVRVLTGEGVLGLSADVMTDTTALDRNNILAAERVSQSNASQVARERVAQVALEQSAGVIALSADQLITHHTRLAIYAPEVSETEFDVEKRSMAAPQLVYEVDVHDDNASVSYTVTQQASNGEVLFARSNSFDCMHREVYRDWIFNSNDQRIEGDPASLLPDTNTAYDLLQVTYDHFNWVHGRLGWHNNCWPIRAVSDDDYLTSISPNGNARFFHIDGFPQYDSVLFTAGFVTDDIMGHEYTHGIIAFTSNLNYTATESGAINECFADIFGESIDLTFAWGTDTAAVEWLIGEDTSFMPVRDMDEPNQSPYVVQPKYLYQANYWYTGTDIGAYVHINSGVGNKFFHLIAAGDPQFRSFPNPFVPLDPNLNTSIFASGRLMYEVMVTLPSTADYYLLGDRIEDMAIDASLGLVNLGYINWNATSLQRVINALIAVDIY